MMSLIGNQPVMWVNVISLLAGGPYSESNMLLWNRELIQAWLDARLDCVTDVNYYATSSYGN